MYRCTRCGAELVDIPLAIAVPAKEIPKEKADGNSEWHWSQVSQKVCPVCGAQDVHITCSRRPGPE